MGVKKSTNYYLVRNVFLGGREGLRHETKLSLDISVIRVQPKKKANQTRQTHKSSVSCSNYI